MYKCEKCNEWFRSYTRLGEHLKYADCESIEK